MQKIEEQDPLVCEKTAAKVLSMSLSWLQHSRIDGDGPAFIRLGRAIRYRLSVLNQYKDLNTFKSTSDVGEHS